MNDEAWAERIKRSISGTRIVAKLFGIFMLVLVLLIPLNMIESVLDERLQRRNETLDEITGTWGRDQSIIGPVLVVPFRYTTSHWENRTVGTIVERFEVRDTAVARAFFLPKSWQATGEMEPHARYRGIYQTTVYSAELALEGTFDVPDYEAIRIREDQFLWDQAFVSLGMPDLRGTRGALKLAWGDSELAFSPNSHMAELGAGVHSPLRKFAGFSGPIAFRIPLTFNGNSTLLVAPVGIENRVELKSVWMDPAFRGAFLPIERTVSDQGFSATWSVSHLGRDFPQFWTDQGGTLDRSKITASLFGVELVTLIDSYRNVERAIKYGILFLTMVFTAFFLFEMTGSRRVHVFQYILVGAALCLFYLLLLSLSELIRFGLAYAIAASAATALISLYTAAVLKSGRRALWIFSMLLTIYVFLYVTLQLQDYALLTGSIGLTAALAIVMYVTRNIDWYADKSGS